MIKKLNYKGMVMMGQGESTKHKKLKNPPEQVSVLRDKKRVLLQPYKEKFNQNKKEIQSK